MLSHARIWAAIDALAARHDLSASGLAKRAGLDSTTFNKSKRFAADGRPRWPSTESLAKIMEATGSSLDDFLALVRPRRSAGSIGRPNGSPSVQPVNLREVPLLGLAQAGDGGFFDDAGFPAGQGWDTVSFPGKDFEDGCYALEISGDSMLPLYREGDKIIVAPSEQLRRGDRVVVKTRDGEVMAKTLLRRTPELVELQSANPDHPDRTFPAGEIEWIARIVWASQ
ncbi:helix-turn-helix transcriptional regulator [Oricola cellulosilytica]|uniref:Helix-turn-helix transcriptional regulator n=1 Tax=Oricola cellulosilytica TaxID=1429082 RepID=A0A4R0PFA7_9HYPH|nr:helix-turn-helix transcriptional regulator [Oricola cellulosilytica]TCD16517.1 helix-turn-helix transcriptional regulator [Oricola cellulosilytica]